MPIRRQRAQVLANDSLVELLVGLALDEGLGALPTPEWALGTSVEEIFEALAILGDGAWLDGYYSGRGIYEGADQWLMDFFAGRDVPVPSDL